MAGIEIRPEGEGGKLGKYGRRVIGEAAANAQAQAIEVGVQKYGPRVIGKEAFDAAQKKLEGVRPPVATRSTALRRPKAATKTATKTPAELTPADDSIERLRAGGEAATEAYVSTKEVVSMLDENPAAFDQVLEAELARQGGPRRGVLRDMLAREQQREGGPRADTVQAIEKHL